VSLCNLVGWVYLWYFLWVGCLFAISRVGCLSAFSRVGCLSAILRVGCLPASSIGWGGVRGSLFAMEGDGVSPHAEASSSSQRKKKANTDAHRESAHNAKVERGRVKRQHRQNTLVYYASSRNRDNVRPLEIARNVPHPHPHSGSDASND
jgi:hypothetical protein